MPNNQGKRPQRLPHHRQLCFFKYCYVHRTQKLNTYAYSAQFNIIQHNLTQSNTSQHNRTQHNSLQHNSQHSSPQLNTIQQTRQTQQSVRLGEAESVQTKLLQFIESPQLSTTQHSSTDATDATVRTTRRSQVRPRTSNQTLVAHSAQSFHLISIIDSASLPLALALSLHLPLSLDLSALPVLLLRQVFADLDA